MESTTNNPAETTHDEFPEWIYGEEIGEMPYEGDRDDGTPEFDE